jgi:hypothetical protein
MNLKMHVAQQPPAVRDAAQLRNAQLVPGDFPHQKAGSWTGMIPTIRAESQAAIAGHTRSRGAQGQLPSPSVVVHLRCGDILSGKHLAYGFAAFSWYLEHIPKETKHIQIVGNLKAASARRKDADRGALGKCNAIGLGLYKYLSKHTSAAVHMPGGEVTEDFSRMVNADILIGSTSRSPCGRPRSTAMARAFYRTAICSFVVRHRKYPGCSSCTGCLCCTPIKCCRKAGITRGW